MEKGRQASYGRQVGLRRGLRSTISNFGLLPVFLFYLPPVPVDNRCSVTYLQYTSELEKVVQECLKGVPAELVEKTSRETRPLINRVTSPLQHALYKSHSQPSLHNAPK